MAVNNHPHIVYCRGKGYLLTHGEYGGVYSDDLAIFPNENKAKNKAVTLTAESAEPHQHECYRHKMTELAREGEKDRRRRVRDYRNTPIAHVPINKVYVPANPPDDDLREFAERNYMCKFDRPLTVLYLVVRGVNVVGVIYEQDGDINGMDDHEFNDFEEVFRTKEHVDHRAAQAVEPELNGHVEPKPEVKGRKKK